MNDAALLLLAEYLKARSEHPGEGRRRWKLRAAREIWGLDAESFKQTAASLRSEVAHDVPWAADHDDFDLNDGPEDERIIPLKGVIVRTDYSNDQAWDSFLGIVRAAEKEALEDSDTAMEGDDSGEGTSGSDEGEEGPETTQATGQGSGGTPAASTTSPLAVFHILDLSLDRRSHAINASNIVLLRLLADLKIIYAPRPAPPSGQYFVAPKARDKPISPMNPLVEKFGYKEAYEGRTIWVYDTLSNTDGCVRLIDGGLDGQFGSSTGDSWRARASHMWELHVNMSTGGMKIDFGGQDRWSWGAPTEF
ncbi:hypothetical protein FRB94_005142 [Tulasnella sp. JGI-2019a]|nr:hypothetical protein FRB94_005142 [Tulasnella sp. JGI-2019a]KAG9035812.1 hypothetical protein FRB95_010406 [Tulasnella sp. JGI-2019a]